MTGAVFVLAPLLAAQVAVVDRAVLIVREGETAFGRESYELREGSLDDRSQGHRLEARIVRGSRTSRLSIQADAAGGAREFALEVTSATGERAMLLAGQMGRGVFVIRSVAAGGERGQQMAVSRAPVTLSDSAYASYALLSHRLVTGDSSFIVVVPESGRRVSARVADGGLGRTQVNGVPATLRRLDLQLGEERRTVWLCPEDNRFVKLEVPARNTVVERQPTGS